MEEKKIIYQIFIDCWNLAKKYFGEHLSDEQWELFLKEGDELWHRYEKYDKNVHQLYRTIFQAIVHYQESKEKEYRKNGNV